MSVPAVNVFGNAVLDNAVLAVCVSVVGIGGALYVASFFDNGWKDGGTLAVVAFFLIALSSVPMAVRDRRFFLKYWGFGLTGIRSHFPLQFFPARSAGWLNGVGWCFMGILLLHFGWITMGTRNGGAPQEDTSMALRYVSLMVTFAGVLNALSWKYPPTEKPQNLDSSR